METTNDDMSTGECQCPCHCGGWDGVGTCKQPCDQCDCEE